MYDKIYLPLRYLSANGWSIRTPPEKVYVGRLTTKEPRSVMLAFEGGYTSIGFECVPLACEQLRDVPTGDEVLAIFGTTIVTGGDHFINELRSIRTCLLDDDECAKAKQAYARRRQEQDVKSRKAAKILGDCFGAMTVTLESDRRHAPPVELSHEESVSLSERFDSLTGKERQCAFAVVQEAGEALVESCRIYGCGDMIGGGCDHLTAYIGDARIALALKRCAGP